MSHRDEDQLMDQLREQYDERKAELQSEADLAKASYWDAEEKDRVNPCLENNRAKAQAAEVWDKAFRKLEAHLGRGVYGQGRYKPSVKP